MSMKGKGFTLIELLVVIAILAVLATAVVLVLNPAELIKQGRDSTRISDMAALNSAISLWVADVRTAATTTAWGTSGAGGYWGGSGCYIGYTSSTSATGAPGASSTATCTSASTTASASSSVSGGGWVPLNFTLVSSGSPLSKLPVDPNNGGTCRLSGSSTTVCQYVFAAYGTVGTYQVDAAMESVKYSNSGAADVVSTDNGSNSNWYEVGSSLSLIK